MKCQVELSRLPFLYSVIPGISESHIEDIGQNCSAHHYTQPGKLFPKNIANSVYEILVPVTSYAFGADMTGYWKNRRAGNYLENSEELVLLTNSGNKIIGWSGYSIINNTACTIIYNDSSGVIPPYQNKGLMGTIFKSRVSVCLEKFQRQNVPLYFSTRTESPVIYKMRQRLMSKIYPNPNYPTPNRVTTHAKILADWLGQLEKFEAESLIVRNAYDMVDDLYGELPTSEDQELNQWIYSQLSSVDAFLLMGEVDKNPT